MIAAGLALLIGGVAGLRTMTALAAASWAAHLGLVRLGDGWFALIGSAWAAWILTALALVEFVTDQLPSTQSRTVPVQFGARLVSGALSGAVIGVAASPWIGAGAGLVGAVAGTLGGAAARARLAGALGRDRPAALIEDAVAIALAAVVVAGLR